MVTPKWFDVKMESGFPPLRKIDHFDESKNCLKFMKRKDSKKIFIYQFYAHE